MRLLREWYARNSQRKFTWGHWDCCLAAADWWETVTGTHPAKDAIGAYSTLGEAHAYKLTKADSFVGMITSYVGKPLENNLMVATGDVVVIRQGLGHVACVAFEGSLLAPGTLGLQVLPLKLDAVKGVWRP